MEILRIVIIGAAEFISPSNNKISSLPEEVEEAISLCEDKDFKLLVYIIDEHLYRPTKGDKEILKSYPKNVGFYPQKYQDIFHSNSARVVAKDSAEKFDSFRNTKEKIIYINTVSPLSATATTTTGTSDDLFQRVLDRPKSAYDLAFMVHTETFTNKYFLCFQTGKFSLATVVQYFFNDQLKELYNPVSGNVIPSHEDQEAVRRIIKTGLEHLIWYLKAGYLDYENKLQVPCWVLQASSCWNQAIIDHYLIAPGMPEFQGGLKNIGFADQDIQIYMNDYSGFRKAIADCTLAVLSNFVINNKLIAIEQIKDWKSLDLWTHINSIY